MAKLNLTAEQWNISASDVSNMWSACGYQVQFFFPVLKTFPLNPLVLTLHWWQINRFLYSIKRINGAHFSMRRKPKLWKLTKTSQSTTATDTDTQSTTRLHQTCLATSFPPSKRPSTDRTLLERVAWGFIYKFAIAVVTIMLRWVLRFGHAETVMPFVSLLVCISLRCAT